MDQADMRMVSGIQHNFPAFSDSLPNKTILDFLKISALPVSHFTTQTAASIKFSDYKLSTQLIMLI
jgi:hypothetical protein